MARLGPWLIVLLCAAVMFTLSTAGFSHVQTGRVILPVLRWLLPHASDRTLDLLHEFIRKCAHVFEYSVLSLLLFRAVRAPRKGWQLRWAATALILAALFAASDEIHQVFVPNRGPSVYDVLLDTTAAAAMQCLIWLWLRRTLAAPTRTSPRIS
jgi:VanZ family protein